MYVAAQTIPRRYPRGSKNPKSGVLGRRVQGPRFLGSRVQGSGFRVQSLGFRVQGLGLSGFQVPKPSLSEWSFAPETLLGGSWDLVSPVIST